MQLAPQDIITDPEAWLVVWHMLIFCVLCVFLGQKQPIYTKLS